ncbi:MAG TPA: LysR family transcriptional regulator [Hyphomicrobiales bacterium]|nr:LysR family transcriptional regulator [Kaistiaceae bacterium]HQF30458.1 LysR family transcriptional regulator [Hyphomicrobiales bacterium]
MTDNIARMQTFVAVAEHGGFSAAGRALGRSKALISKHVRELEDAYGARLVNRTTRTFSLTDAGEIYFREALDILKRIEALDDRIRDSGGPLRGRLRVSAPRSFGGGDLGRAILAFAAAEPGIDLDLRLEDRFVDLVEEGFDVAVRVAALADSSLIARRLAPFRVVVCATPETIARHGAPARPEDLGGRPCVLDSNLAQPDIWVFGAEGGRLPVTVSGRIRVNGAGAVREATLAGLGFARVPLIAVGDAVAEGRLEIVLAEFEPADVGIFVVYPDRRHLARKVRAFVDHMVRRFAAERR